MHATVQPSSRHVRRGHVAAGELPMYYEIGGAGPPLLLLHAGFLTIESSFEKLRAPLRERHNVVALEQQGHGRTRDIDRPMSYRQMVEDTAAALNQLRIDRTSVFGWSDGGVVALGLALEYPELVDKVAIIGAGYSPDAEPPEFRERMRTLAPDDERFRDFRRQYEKVAPEPAAWPRLVEKVKAMYLSFAGWDEARLSELAAPLMVMLGDRDFTRLEHALELYRRVPDGRLAVLPGSDHGAPLEHADWVAAMLLEFFGE
jgi:pimeloyl-ACP methyl ester carboxylesterase